MGSPAGLFSDAGFHAGLGSGLGGGRGEGGLLFEFCGDGVFAIFLHGRGEPAGGVEGLVELSLAEGLRGAVGGSKKLRFLVRTNVKATYTDAGDKKPPSVKNEIKPEPGTDIGNGPSLTRGGTYMKLRSESAAAKLQRTFAHEFGHLIGHRDFYQENMTDREAPGYAVWNRPGWDGNLMARSPAPGWTVLWRNALEILRHHNKHGAWEAFFEPDFSHIQPNIPPKVKPDYTNQ